MSIKFVNSKILMNELKFQCHQTFVIIFNKVTFHGLGVHQFTKGIQLETFGIY